MLLIAMTAVYLIKNDGTREGLLGNLESVISRFAFANRKIINLEEITFSEIDMDAFGGDRENDPEAIEPEPVQKQIIRIKEADEPEDLKRIESEIRRIAQETKELEVKVKELVALREINEQVEDIAEMLAEITEGIKIASAVSEGYPVSSI